MELVQQLAQLSMWSPRDNTGLLWTTDLHSLPPDERLIVEDARKYKADAVYVRRFPGAKAAIPQVYIYNFEQSFDLERFTELRKRLWNFGQVPMLMGFSSREVKIFNCFKSPFDNKGNYISKPFEIIRFASETKNNLDLRKAFSARMLDNGSFWDSDYGRKFRRTDSAYVQLLNQLKMARKILTKQGQLSLHVTERLLILSIMIK